MTISDDAEALVAAAPCNVVLPAGAGKTELLAHIALHQANENQRVLFLTHTNAGVVAFRQRLHRLNVPRRTVHASTIAAFAERWCRNYPALAGLSRPDLDGLGFTDLMVGAGPVLAATAVQRVLGATWDIVLVDEYQDCQLPQHAAVVAIAAAVPTVIVGDPLQAVFNFEAQPTVDWTAVDDAFDRVHLASVPHRWATTNVSLGHELTGIRQLLEQRKSVDLTAFPSIKWTAATNYTKVPEVKRVADLAGTSAVLARQRAQCTHLAKNADGRLEAIEDLAATDLVAAAAQLDDGSPAEQLATIAELAKKCMAKLPPQFNQRMATIVDGKAPNFQSNSTLGPLTAAALTARDTSTPQALRAVIRAISNLPGIVVARRELWDDLSMVLTAASRAPGMTLREAATQLSRARRHGHHRRLDRVAGTPLLLKGLEFDHCLVVDADQLTVEELYVALTRGRGTVSVLSGSPTLGPWS